METKDKIIEMIPESFGMGFEALKVVLMQSYKKNGYGCSDTLHDKKNGYSVSYTDNKNYMGGSINGGGSGFFAHLNTIGGIGRKTIKLSN